MNLYELQLTNKAGISMTIYSMSATWRGAEIKAIREAQKTQLYDMDIGEYEIDYTKIIASENNETCLENNLFRLV